MKLIFGRNHLPLSYVIRFLNWSQWSHVAVLLDDGRVVEAVWSGVRLTTFAECTKRMSKYTLVELEQKDALTTSNAVSWLLDQVGKGYDKSALFGFLAKRDWQNPRKWFCSELVAAFCKKLGYRIANESQLNRITPQFLYMITDEQ